MGNRTAFKAALAVVALSPAFVACGDGDPVTPVLNATAPQRLEAMGSNEVAVPFRGESRGSMHFGTQDPAEVATFCGPGYHLYGEYVGVGNATHFGRFTKYLATCIDLEDREWVGDVALEAANGDRMWGSVGGTAEWIDPAGMVASWEAVDFRLSQGDGRFVNAVIEGAWRGVIDLLAGEAWSSFDGTFIRSAGRP